MAEPGKVYIMKRACKATLGLIAAAVMFSSAPAGAEGVHICEDFESYASGVGDWLIGNSNNITVSLGLNLNTPIVGVKDLKVNLNASLLGSEYTISNSNLNISMPASAEKFSFKLKPLIALNLLRNVVVTLRDQNNVSHVSQAESLGLLQLGTASDLDFDLDDFSPPVDASVTTVNRVDIKFTTTVASLAAEEHIDQLRLLWDNSAVSDWMCY